MLTRGSKNTLLTAVCLIAGIGVSVWGVIVVLDALASSNWPTVEGVVVSSGVERGSSGTGTSRSTSYHAKVDYTYEVDGVAYQAERVSFKDAISKSRGHAEEISNSYKVGQAVVVAYDAEDPGNAVLEPGLSPASFIYLAFGLALLGLGVYTAVSKGS